MLGAPTRAPSLYYTASRPGRGSFTTFCISQMERDIFQRRILSWDNKKALPTHLGGALQFKYRPETSRERISHEMATWSDKKQDQEATWSISINVDLASRRPYDLGLVRLAVQKWKDSLQSQSQRHICERYSDKFDSHIYGRESTEFGKLAPL